MASPMRSRVIWKATVKLKKLLTKKVPNVTDIRTNYMILW